MENLILNNEHAKISVFKNNNQTDMPISIYIGNFQTNETLGISLKPNEIDDLRQFLNLLKK